MSKNKSAKYKITDTDIDKKFIGKQVTVEKIKFKGGPGSDGGRKSGSTNKITLAKLSDKVDTLANNLNAVTNNLDKLANIVIGMSNDIKDIKNDVVNLNNRFDNLVKVNNLKE